MGFAAVAEQQPTLRDDHLLFCWNQIDAVRFDLNAVLDQMHRQLGAAGQDLIHQTLEVRGQVLHDHERHPRVEWDLLEESLERLEPACRCADADYGNRNVGFDHLGLDESATDIGHRNRTLSSNRARARRAFLLLGPASDASATVALSSRGGCAMRHLATLWPTRPPPRGPGNLVRRPGVDPRNP